MEIAPLDLKGQGPELVLSCPAPWVTRPPAGQPGLLRQAVQGTIPTLSSTVPWAKSSRMANSKAVREGTTQRCEFTEGRMEDASHTT